MNTKSAVKAGIVLLAVPFSAIGAFWLLWMLDYNMSIAAWVGLIALMGLDAETGVFMLLFLDISFWERVREGKMKTFDDLTEAIVHGAKRIGEARGRVRVHRAPARDGRDGSGAG
jgi:Cu(I)/Ag(I) efflux system membrane protein CusA/SilA